MACEFGKIRPQATVGNSTDLIQPVQKVMQPLLLGLK